MAYANEYSMYMHLGQGSKLEEEGKGTRLSIKILPAKYTGQLSFLKKLTSGLMGKLAIFKIRKTNKAKSRLFKEYCEKVARERGL